MESKGLSSLHGPCTHFWYPLRELLASVSLTVFLLVCFKGNNITYHKGCATGFDIERSVKDLDGGIIELQSIIVTYSPSLE